jgi:hypothetical protein
VNDECELIEFLRAPDPARVPLRVCCVFSLLDRDENMPVCALEREPAPEPEPVP